MPIKFRCTCGKVLAARDEHAGRRAKCPTCGAVVEVPKKSEARPASAPAAPRPAPAPSAAARPAAAPAGKVAPPPKAVAPPPRVNILIPTALKPKFQRPGLPSCWIEFDTNGAVVDADFDVSSSLVAFAEGFAKKLKKRFDVRLGTPPDASAPGVRLRIVSLEGGSFILRLLLGFLAGQAHFEVDGNVTGPTGAPKPFHLRQRSWGIWLDSGRSNLNTAARLVGIKVAKMM